mgnify:FL=1
MNQIKILLWDLDGTINDFLATENYAIKKGFARLNLGLCTDEMVNRYSQINISYWEKLEKGEMSKPQILVNRFKDFFAEYGLPEQNADIFNKNYQIDLGDKLIFIDGSLEVLQKIKKSKKIRQFVVTNGLVANQKRKLEGKELKPIFEYSFISDEVGFEKPNIEFFNAVFQKIGDISKNQIMIIGDSLTSDIKGGNNAGIKTCWFNPHGKTNNKGVHIDYEISDLRQLLKILCI